MKKLISIFLLVACSFAPAQLAKHTLNPAKQNRNLYPDDANAKEEIQDALARAKEKNKRVLLVFGANWCYDCFVLEQALHESDIAPIREKSYEVVHVDIGQGEKNTDLMKKYKMNIERGVPALAVLDASGKLLFSDKDGEFEAARRMAREDLIAFLEKWAPVESKNPPRNR